MHGAKRAPLRAHVVDDPPEPLGLLACAVLLRGHRGHLVQLVVDHGYRDEIHVVDPALPEGVYEVPQDPVARRTQLAGARPAALDVPLEVEALAEQVAQILAEDRLVDGRILHAPSDEDVAVTPSDRPKRPEVEVAAPEHVIRREPVPVQHRSEHERVEVRPVARQEHQRVRPVQAPQLVDAAGVDIDGVCTRDPLTEMVPGVDGELALAGNHLVECGRRLVRHLLGFALVLLGETLHQRREARARDDVLPHQSGNLVPAADDLPLRPLEREDTLALDEGLEALAVPTCVTLAEVADGRGLARDHPVALLAGDPCLCGRRRLAWISESQHVAQARAASSATFGWEPCDANRNNVWVTVAMTHQPLGELVAAGVDGGRVNAAGFLDPVAEHVFLGVGPGVQQ